MLKGGEQKLALTGLQQKWRFFSFFTLPILERPTCKEIKIT
jgi:hypothetical protein